MRTALHYLHRKHIWLPLLVGVLVLVPGVAFAAEEWLQEQLYDLVTTIFGMLVWLGGTILDYGLQSFVFEFSDRYINNFGFTIDYLWSVIRDLFNLTFIFGLVYIGFRLIFKADDSHARKALVMLIGAALLVNFSLFFAKTVVDFSNLAAYEVAKGITVISSGGNTAASTVGGGVAGQFLNIFGLQGIFSQGDLNYDQLGDGGGWAYIFGIMLVFMVAAFVFAAGGILLIVRFITLSILMIFSPLMFIGMVFPFFSNYSSMWWKKFLGQAFVAPAYIFMLYLSLYVLQAIGPANAEGSLSEMFSTTTYATGAQVLMIFLVGAGFLIASLMVAQKMGAAGANTAMSVGKNLRQRGQRALGGATFGAGARIGRNTVGAAAQKISDNEKVQGWAARNRALGGEAILSGTRGVADSSFDARKVGGFGKKAGIGEGRKGGFTTAAKESAKKREKFLESLKTTDVRNEHGELNEGMEGRIQNDPEVKRKMLAIKAAENSNAKPEVVAKFKRELARARKAAEGKIEYKNQLDYIDSLEGSSRSWKQAYSLLTGGASGAAGGFAGSAAGVTGAAATGGVAGVAAGATGLGHSYALKTEAKALRKIYGEDGTKMKKKKQQKDALKLFDEVRAENSDSNENANQQGDQSSGNSENSSST